MKLRTVEITDFQSIRNSNAFEIGDITCLVGKNEAGKTALLQALYRLNPIVASEGNFDVTDDYPRTDVEDYQQDVEQGIRQPARVVNAIFVLEEKDLKSLHQDFGAKILNSKELTLSKGYDNTRYITLDINEKVVIDKLIKEAQLPSEIAGQFAKNTTVNDLINDTKAVTEETDHINRLKEVLSKVEKAKGISVYLFKNYIEKTTPKFLYFDEYYQMRGHENIEKLMERKKSGELLPSDHPMLGLIELARLNIDQLLEPERTQALKNKLQGASNFLSKKVLKYWSQNKNLQMLFDVRPALPGDPEGMREGTNIWAEIYDTKHLASTGVGKRSRGFVWFFSFLAWFSQQQKKNLPFLLLLDEPGLSLHAKAQEDLLRFMEKELKESHQIIYTTHSPFMIDPKRFDRVRIVEDKSMETEDELPVEEEGTKVLTDVLEASENSLFPLQGALGYEVYQNLFIGPNSLVVEGVSDLLYIQTISGLLDEVNKGGLSDKWVITPVGGSDKVPTFVALIGAQTKLKVATLIDFQNKDRQTIENLFKKKLLKKKNVLTFADFTNTSEADIEDMFEPAFYLKLVNSAFEADLSKPLNITDLKSKVPRILVRLEEHLKEKPLKNKSKFNHYRPARYFANNVSDLKSHISQKTLDRFEAAFHALNKLL